MHYFVTGATGFIGKRLVKALLARRGTTVSFLMREGSEGKLAALYEYWGLSGAAKKRATPVAGDLTARKLGVAADTLKALKGTVDAVYLDRLEKVLGKASKRVNKAIDRDDYDKLVKAVSKSADQIDDALES